VRGPGRRSEAGVGSAGLELALLHDVAVMADAHDRVANLQLRHRQAVTLQEALCLGVASVIAEAGALQQLLRAS